MRASRVVIAFGAGMLLAVAFEPVDLPALSVVAVALLSALAWSSTWRSGALLGAAFGLPFSGGLLWWLWASIGPGAWLALTVAQGAWFALLGAGLTAIRARPLRVWSTALLWTAVEELRSAWPLGGLPWGRLGYAAIDTVWQGWLRWGGVTGATFVLALLGASLAHLAMARRHDVRPLSAAIASGVVVALSLVPATASASARTSDADLVRVAVVQGGVPGAGNRLVEHHREVTDNHLRETVALARRLRAARQPPPDFVLWPENSTAVDPLSDERAGNALRTAARAAGRPLLAGSVTDGSTATTARNQGIVWSPTGVPEQRYTKRHLVPFGEYVPWRSLAERLSRRIAEIPRDMVPGIADRPLDVGGVLVADALCFDVAYADVISTQVRRGASLVAVQTSNAMFLGTAQLAQQWDISRVRAVETGRSVVVASVNGMSGAIDPDGQAIARLPIRRTASAVVDVPLSQSLTPAVRWAQWPGRAAVALSLVAMVAATAPRLRRPSTIQRSTEAEEQDT